jgi:hypothetical protein
VRRMGRRVPTVSGAPAAVPYVPGLTPWSPEDPVPPQAFGPPTAPSPARAAAQEDVQ